MARIIACSNIKGGEGKTTLARHLALFAEDKGLKTLAIDLDPQGDLTVSLCPPDKEATATSYDLFGKEFDAQEVREHLIEVTPRLHLLPSSDELDDVDQEDDRDSSLRLASAAIRALAGGYDVVILDTPTNARTCYMTGMAAADATLSPIQLDTYGMRAAGKFIKASSSVRSKFNPTLKHLGFVVNRFNGRSKSHLSMLDELKESGLPVLPTILRERAAVQDALDRQTPVWSGPSKKVNRAAAKEFRDMCADVFTRAGIAFPAPAAAA